MTFYTRDDFKTRSFMEAKAKAEKYHMKSASTKHHVFLSHSHKDSDIIEYVVSFLGAKADSIYIDWKDGTMPKITSPETALRLKTKIKKTAKFILLATNNALASTWVPWELGVADSSNSMKNVAVLPVKDHYKTWKGSEYIGIYSRIIQADSGAPGVFEPGKDRGISLSRWLTQ